MPKRPPKSWFRRAVSAIRRSGSASDPERVAGAAWYHKLTPWRKRQIIEEERKDPPMAVHRGHRKQMILSMVRNSSEAAASECSGRRMHASARAFRVLGDATASIGSHVSGWEGAYGVGSSVRAAPIRVQRRKSTKRGRITRREAPWMKGLRAARRARKAKAHPKGALRMGAARKAKKKGRGRRR